MEDYFKRSLMNLVDDILLCVKYNDKIKLCMYSV